MEDRHTQNQQVWGLTSKITPVGRTQGSGQDPKPHKSVPPPVGELPHYPAEPTSLPIERELKHLKSELGKVEPQSKKLRKFPLRTAGNPPSEILFADFIRK